MPRSDRDKRSFHGDQFEAEIADIYSAMGYQVSRHFPLHGQEVNILAERHIPGAGTYRVLVECKYKGGKTLAGNDDVQAIAGAYQIGRSTHSVSACTLVTTNGFSLQAQEAARSAGILTTTKRELVQKLLDFSVYHHALRNDYATDFGTGEESWYIPARARQNDTEIESLVDFVDSWRTQDKRRPLVIMGGYGTGKTSFCRHYAMRMLERQEQMFPIIISLREFQKAARVESVVRDFLEDECHAGAPRFDSLWRMYQEGMLLLIFDGFDEMAARVDTDVLEMNLAEIEKFAYPPANIILTARPEVFVTKTEEIQALAPAADILSSRRVEYERVEMELWSPEQVAEFVRKRLNAIQPPATHPAEFYLDRIERLPELRDMSARAVHLDLVVRVLPEMVVRRIPITRPNLYRAYIERELRRETVQNRRLRVISDEDRMALIREVAVSSFLEQHDHLNFDTAAELVQRVLKPPRSEVESLTRDLLNRSFLRRQGDTYEFAHKSLGEYLFATYLYEKLRTADRQLLTTATPTAAVAGMVLELFGGIQEFEQMRLALGFNPQREPTQEDLIALEFINASLTDHIFNLHAHSRGLEHESAILLANLSHEVRTPINALLGYCSLAIEGAIPMQMAAEKIQRTWNNFGFRIYELQRIEVDRLAARLTFNLQLSVLDLVELIRSSLEVSGKLFDFQGDSTGFMGDRTLLEHAFHDLSHILKEITPDEGLVKVILSEEGQWTRILYTSDSVRQDTNTNEVVSPSRFLTYDAERYLTYHRGHLMLQIENDQLWLEILLPQYDLPAERAI